MKQIDRDYAEAKEVLNDYIYRETKGVVQSGPFAGMTVPRVESWKDQSVGVRLLGCYEQELHAIIESEIARIGAMESGGKVTDLGCAEGYYAVGLARRLPDATVYANDVDSKALQICEAAAQMNNVGNVVVNPPLEDSLNGPDLLICDVEGAETIYLDLDKCPGLARSNILVECHDYPENPATDTLIARFKQTHHIGHIREGPRDPNVFPCLINLPSIERWLAVCEGRPVMMWWLYMKPRSK